MFFLLNRCFHILHGSRSITLHHRMREEQNPYSKQIKEFDKRIQVALDKKEELKRIQLALVEKNALQRSQLVEEIEELEREKLALEKIEELSEEEVKE